MGKQEILKKIQKQADLFFAKIGFGGKPLVEFDEDQTTILISLKLEDPQVLIGKKGETLGMLQHLLAKIAKKAIGQETQIALDINDYRKRKASFLKELAQVTADEVALNKKEKELEEERANLQATNKELAREQAASQNLKEELDKTNKLKSALEVNLKEVLASVKKAKK